jgi:hypothetical protein
LDLRTYAHNLVEHALYESLKPPSPAGFTNWSERPLRAFFNNPEKLSAFIEDVFNGARLLRLELVKKGNVEPSDTPEDFFVDMLRLRLDLKGTELMGTEIVDLWKSIFAAVFYRTKPSN